MHLYVLGSYSTCYLVTLHLIQTVGSWKCNGGVEKHRKWVSIFWKCQFSSVTQSCPSLLPHGLQHARLPCPSPTPGAYSSSCPSNRWCHPTIPSSVVPFSHLQSFPASGSLQMSKFFTSGGRSIGASASASVLPMDIQDWFPLGLTGWISLQSKGLSSLFQHHSSEAPILHCSAFFMVKPSHPYMTTGKTTALTRRTFADKVMSLLFNMLSKFVTAFLPRSKHILISFVLTSGVGNGNLLQYSCLENPMDGGACRLHSMGLLRVGHDWVTSLSLFTFMHWRRKWQPTPVFLPGESQGRGSLVGCRVWGWTELDTTEAT